MQDEKGVVRRLGQALRGERRKTSRETTSSTNSSSQMPRDTESQLRSALGFLPTPNGTTAPADSSSTSSPTEFESLGMSKESEREGVLIIHLSTFGSEAQAIDTARRCLHDIRVKGFEISRATYNGVEVEGFEPS